MLNLNLAMKTLKVLKKKGGKFLNCHLHSTSARKALKSSISKHTDSTTWLKIRLNKQNLNHQQQTPCSATFHPLEGKVQIHEWCFYGQGCEFIVLISYLIPQLNLWQHCRMQVIGQCLEDWGYFWLVLFCIGHFSLKNLIRYFGPLYPT